MSMLIFTMCRRARMTTQLSSLKVPYDLMSHIDSSLCNINNFMYSC